MSGIALIWAANVKGLKPAAKVVLIQLSDFHNKETGQCNPSAQRLAAECEMDRATVFRHLVSLEKRGLVTRHARGDGTGGRTSNHYELHIDLELDRSSNSEEKSQIATVGDVANPKKKSRRGATGVVANCDTNLNTEHQKEPGARDQRQALPFSEDWQPSEDDRRWAWDEGFDDWDIEHETKLCRDYHLGKHRGDWHESQA